MLKTQRLLVSNEATLGREVFQIAYSGKALRDIGKPQTVFEAVAKSVTGSVLVVAGEKALDFASRGARQRLAPSSFALFPASVPLTVSSASPGEKSAPFPAT